MAKYFLKSFQKKFEFEEKLWKRKGRRKTKRGRSVYEDGDEEEDGDRRRGGVEEEERTKLNVRQRQNFICFSFSFCRL